MWTPRARLWQGPEKGPGPSLGFLAGFLFLSSGGFFLRKQLGEEWKCVFVLCGWGWELGSRRQFSFLRLGHSLAQSPLAWSCMTHRPGVSGCWEESQWRLRPVLTTGRQNHFRFGCVTRLGVHTQAVPLASTVAVSWCRLRGGSVCCPLLEWAHPPQGDVRPYGIQGHP